jgi:hypothetical protein
MTNINCLEGIQCPQCGNEDTFRIAAKTIATVTDDGTDDVGDMEWDDDSYAECTGCHRHGTLKDFRAAAEVASARHTPGPWQQSWQFIVAPDPTGFHPDIYIAEIAEEDDEGRIASPGQQAANARLIIAAPELLAACRMVVERRERGDLAEAARACRDAVALVTDGRPPWDITDGALKPYSVLLHYPDYIGDYGTETYYAFVEASNPIDAVTAARGQAVAANDCVEIDPEDLAPLLVTKGHHYGEPLFNQ